MTNNDIVVAHSEKLELCKQAMRTDGPNQLHVIADFDNTLTRAFVDGEKAPSIIGQLRKGNYLTPDYAAQAQALFDHYAPIEQDHSLPLPQRIKEMDTWWRTHFALLERSGFNRETINDVVLHSTLQFRKDTKAFIDLLEKHQIPLIIMSAAPGDMLIAHLEHENLLRPNVHVIANLYEFDQNGNAVKIKEPIIHSLNKHEVVIKNFPVYDSIKNRHNIILLGDNLGDIGMAEGSAVDKIIKIGFLNQNTTANLPIYTENFDIVITDDGSMENVNDLLEQILEKN